MAVRPLVRWPDKRLRSVARPATATVKSGHTTTIRPHSRAIRAAGPGRAIRLDMCRAIDRLGGGAAVGALDFREIGRGIGGESGRVFLDAATLVRDVGDVVLAGKGGTTAYHLAVTLDDAHQGITHVTRGRDLFPATQIHRVLQALLDLPVPIYRHHALVRDEVGKRLAKRDDARAIARYRAEGMSPADVLALAALNAGPSG